MMGLIAHGPNAHVYRYEYKCEKEGCNLIVDNLVVSDNQKKFNLEFKDAKRCEECILNEIIDFECSKCKNTFQQKRRSTETQCPKCIEIGNTLLHKSIITIANVYLRDKDCLNKND